MKALCQLREFHQSCGFVYFMASLNQILLLLKISLQAKLHALRYIGYLWNRSNQNAVTMISREVICIKFWDGSTSNWLKNLDHVSKLRDSSLFQTENSEMAQNSKLTFWAISRTPAYNSMIKVPWRNSSGNILIVKIVTHQSFENELSDECRSLSKEANQTTWQRSGLNKFTVPDCSTISGFHTVKFTQSSLFETNQMRKRPFRKTFRESVIGRYIEKCQVLGVGFT